MSSLALKEFQEERPMEQFGFAVYVKALQAVGNTPDLSDLPTVAEGLWWGPQLQEFALKSFAVSSPASLQAEDVSCWKQKQEKEVGKQKAERGWRGVNPKGAKIEREGGTERGQEALPLVGGVLSLGGIPMRCYWCTTLWRYPLLFPISHRQSFIPSTNIHPPLCEIEKERRAWSAAVHGVANDSVNGQQQFPCEALWAGGQETLWGFW